MQKLPVRKIWHKFKFSYFTASDAGWINGHTYSLFGPLSLGQQQ